MNLPCLLSFLQSFWIINRKNIKTCRQSCETDIHTSNSMYTSTLGAWALPSFTAVVLPDTHPITNASSQFSYIHQLSIACFAKWVFAALPSLTTTKVCLICILNKFTLPE